MYGLSPKKFYFTVEHRSINRMWRNKSPQLTSDSWCFYLRFSSLFPLVQASLKHSKVFFKKTYTDLTIQLYSCQRCKKACVQMFERIQAFTLISKSVQKHWAQHILMLLCVWERASWSSSVIPWIGKPVPWGFTTINDWKLQNNALFY